MSDVQVRGYAIVHAAGYLRQEAGEQAVQALSPALQHALKTATPAGWQPVAHVAELFHAVAKLGDGNEAKAREHLEKCGEYQAIAATTTFLRLVMKVLTPNMFAKKLPSLWSRDSTGGRYLADVHEDHIVCHLKEMEAFEHFAPTSVGYVRYSLKTMGKEVTKTTLSGWSLAKPSSPDMSFSLHWRV
jgi:hypothetical protein